MTVNFIYGQISPDCSEIKGVSFYHLLSLSQPFNLITKHQFIKFSFEFFGSYFREMSFVKEIFIFKILVELHVDIVERILVL